MFVFLVPHSEKYVTGAYTFRCVSLNFSSVSVINLIKVLFNYLMLKTDIPQRIPKHHQVDEVGTNLTN